MEGIPTQWNWLVFAQELTLENTHYSSIADEISNWRDKTVYKA